MAAREPLRIVEGEPTAEQLEAMMRRTGCYMVERAAYHLMAKDHPMGAAWRDMGDRRAFRILFCLRELFSALGEI